MARVDLDSPKKRLALVTGKIHTEKLMTGAHLLYYRPEVEKGKQKQPGIFTARLSNPETVKQKKKLIGTADDYISPDGLLIFSYDQARIKAFEVIKDLKKEFEYGITGRTAVSSKDYTVKQAMLDYIDYLKKNAKKSHSNRLLKINAHIIPELGDIKVSRLTKDRVETWKEKMAEKPRRIQYRVKGNKVESKEGNTDFNSLTEDQKRQRRGTANDLLEILKSGLKQAVDSGKAESPSKGGWQNAEFFKGTRVAKVMFLSVDEQKRLIEACPTEEFRNLVIAGLKTGGRVSELAKLTVKDFNKENRTIHFGPFGKSVGKQRHIFLNDEGVKFFSHIIEGKGSNDFIFTRSMVRFQPASTKRQISEKWLDGDHVYYMRLACKNAKIRNFTFQGLRHTFASILVNEGVALSYIANQLGHSNITLIQTTYGHLAPSEMAKAIRSAMPNILY